MTLSEQRQFNTLNPGMSPDKRRAMRNIENWRSQLVQCGYTIPEVAAPDDLDTFGLDRNGSAEVMADYNNRRAAAIKAMPPQRVIELCRKFKLRFLGQSMPLDLTG